MIAKPRKQTYTMNMYLDKMRDRDIRSDADVQRLAGQWDNGMINELIVTVLTDDYIPPVILGEERNSQLWVIDGLQRSTALMLYRYGNYKITSAIENPVIDYRAKVKDLDGAIRTDKKGDLIWQETQFDIRNKTYDELPDELKKKFNEYQIETVTHEGCDMKRISQLIKRYNNHTSMNTSQKAFTYIDNYARDIRGILEHRFFVDCGTYTEKEKTKGILERVVLETIMCMFHLEEWKKQTKQISTYLNAHATKEEFEKLNQNLDRLEVIVTEDIRDMFTSKDSFLWFTLFHRFLRFGLEDRRFAEFLRAFKFGLRNQRVGGRLFDEADKNRGTKDRVVVIEKIKILEALMNGYLHVKAEKVKPKTNGKADRTEETENLSGKTMKQIEIKEMKELIEMEEMKEADILEFIRENVNSEATEEDLEYYEADFDKLSLEVDNNTKLMDVCNRISLLAVIAYGYKEDIILDHWFVDFFHRSKTYNRDQSANYLQMKQDLEQFLKMERYR